MWKRWFKRLAFTCLVLPLLLVVFLLTEHVRGRVSLGRCKRTLLAQGVKLSPQDFTSGPITGEDGAPEVVQAQKALQAGAVLPDHCPPAMRWTPAGRALVGFREEQWRDSETTNRWDSLAADLAANHPTLARIRAALEAPVLDNQLDFSLGSQMTFKHLVAAKSLTRWFGGQSQLALHDGRTEEALQNLLTCLRFPRLLARDRLAISELVRIAVGVMGRGYTWEALQADGWTDADLKKLQQAWQEVTFAAPMAQALEGEIGFAEASYGRIRSSNTEAAAVLFGLEDYFPHPAKSWERFLGKLPAGDSLVDFCKKQLYCRVWRFAWLDQDEQHYLEQMQRLLAIARSGASTKSWMAIQPDIIRFGEGIATRGFYDRLRYPTESLMSLSGVMRRAMRAEAERSLALCAIAIQRYSLVHGRAPASLDLLAPEFLASVPIDYMDGHALKYHLNSDGSFILYSVGDDGRDDGGDTTLPPGDAGVQNVWARKDVVWPAAALPEEVEAHRRERTRN